MSEVSILNQEIIVYSIVVTFNGKKWIEKSIGSLLSSTIPSIIIVVDNASSDGTPDIIREKFPMVELVESETNLGFGKANNIGIRKAYDKGADYIFLLNQDAWVNQDTIESLIQVQKDFPQFHVLSPIHLNGPGDAIDYNFQTYLSNKWTPDFYSDLFLNKLKPIYEGKYANAAAWLLTNECIRKVGGFDPVFNQYGEDDDYISRLHKASLKLGIVPSTYIYHDRDQSGRMNEKLLQNQLFNRAVLHVKESVVFPKRHYVIRKILAQYFELYFVELGKNSSLRKEINYSKLLLSLPSVIRKRSIDTNTSTPPFL